MLRRVVERIDQGEVDARGWYRERTGVRVPDMLGPTFPEMQCATNRIEERGHRT